MESLWSEFSKQKFIDIKWNLVKCLQIFNLFYSEIGLIYINFIFKTLNAFIIA